MVERGEKEENRFSSSLAGESSLLRGDGGMKPRRCGERGKVEFRASALRGRRVNLLFLGGKGG